MSQTVPTIYAPAGREAKLSPAMRLLAAGVAAAALAVLVTAAWVEPDPQGMGTHLRLGMRPCGMLQRTGLPCASCGMTTSFAWYARGNIAASLYVQPMGTALAVLATLTVWTGFYIAATGRPVLRLLRVVPTRYYLIPLMTLAVAAWAWKMWTHLTGAGGWG